MAKFPNPKSYEQINGDMIATYMAKIGVNDLNVGSAVTSFFEAASQAIYRTQGDTFSILRDFSVDRAEGEALKRLAEEERVFPIPARVATGRVTITDTTFTKISTKIYSGTDAPNVDSTSVNVSDATEFPSTGSIYIGRGGPNPEGPIAYTSIDDLGGYYRFNLSTPTTKYHNKTESVILSQGGVRNIPQGTVVRTVGGGSSPAVNFSVTQAATILDGETEVTNVSVAAQEPGIIGNVPRNSVREFASSPFTGATVTNPSPFTTGRNEETDEEIRIRIKKQRISKGLGTATAIKSYTLGAQSEDDNSIIASNEILSTGDKTTLFIDNGQGYEEATQGVGLEFIVDSALGGEQFFKLATGGTQTSIAKATLVSTLTSPFNINPNDRLAILVGGILSEHVFTDGNFRANGSATAYEVVSSINSNANLKFSARTINNGSQVTLSAKDEEDEYLQKTDPTSGTDAGLALGLQTSEVETLKLFKNGVPLSRNGRTATLESENQTDWSDLITSGETLIIAVDGTDPITYTITDANFASEGTHVTVSKNNTLQSWVNVLNNKITGVTASINGNRIVLSSNLGTDSRSALSIDSGSTLVTKGMFTISSGLTSTGREADFTLSRNTAELKLTNPLEAGDSLTAGSDETEGVVSTTQILGGSVTLTADADVWFMVDEPNAAIVSSGLTGDSLLTITKQASNVVRYRSSIENAFLNIQAGDYVVIWSEEVSQVNRFEGRVHAVGSQLVANDYFEIKVTTSEYALASGEGPLNFSDGIRFLRSDVPPQKFQLGAGTYSISDIADDIEAQIDGTSAKTVDDEYLLVSTTNKQTGGSLLVFTYNDPAKNFNFVEGSLGSSQDSLIGFSTSAGLDSRFPMFIHSSLTTDKSADPTNSYIATLDSALDLSGTDPDAYLVVKHPYLSNGSNILDAQSANESVLIDTIAATSVDIDDSKTIRRIRIGDRYHLLNTLDISHDDIMTVILDGDAGSKTFPVTLYRPATTNATMPINADEFRAYDENAGPTTEFTKFFGNDYSFKNYKALMQAKNAIDPSGNVDEDAVLYRSANWGSSGEKYRIGYFYPTAADLAITSTVTVGENVDIDIRLKSGPAVANNIDGTTEWDVTITADTPVVGVDEVTYSWNTTGSDPTMATLAPGHYVTINQSGEFSEANTGTFKVSAANSTSFTVRRPGGVAVAENNIATLTTNTITMYQNSDTTAQEIVTYATSDLADFITAELLDDNGDTGAGIISASTYEDGDFTSERVQLVDGINWIESSDLDAVAPNSQFVLKNTLSLPSFDTNTVAAYAFNNGEEVRIVPTSIQQVEQFISVLAVSGLTTLAEVSTSSRDSELQIATNLLGSSGSVYVSGGTGNDASALVINVSRELIGTNYMTSSIAKASSGGFSGGSWVKVSAANLQRKVTGISFTTNAIVTPNQPEATTSIIELGNRDITDRFFGEPRNYVRTRSRAFHVEKQGSLVCITWDGVTGSDPQFSKSVDINDADGNIAVTYNSDLLATEYAISSGSRSFIAVQPGDTMTITGFANAANNGTFEVLGVSDDGLTVSVDNTGVDEAALLISAGDISFASEVKEGDSVEIASPFSSLNQGKFRVIRRYGNSIYIDNPSAVEERVVVADNLRDLGFDNTTTFDITVSGTTRIEWAGGGTEPTLENAKMGDVLTFGTSFNANNQGDFMVVDSGDNFIEVQNPVGTAEAGVTVSGVGGNVLQCQISALKFSEYEATNVGDKFVISGSVLGSDNQGTYLITDIISKRKIVVDDILTVVNPAQQFNSLFTQVYVEEENAYEGYKQIHTIATNPSNSLQKILVFNSSEQFNKINQSANVTITGMSKLSFEEETKFGFDSYKYHTGLLAEANKIVYGDPRDTITYSGVAAAGAEIFIEPPLVKRIEISVSIRVNTGVPFARLTEEIRNSIAALVNSNPIGESIAISDVVSQVNAVPGVKAVAISSPAYDVNNDVIVVNPAEKSLILDIVNDITVSKVG